MPKGILVITKNFYPHIGGVESYIIEFIKYCIKNNSMIYVISPLKEACLPNSLRKIDNINLIIPQRNLTFTNLDREKNIVLSTFQSLLYYYFIITSGIRFLRRKKDDIFCIYGIGGPFAIFPSIILARIFRKRCFGHIHADFQFVKRNNFAKVFYKNMFNKLNRLFVNSIDALEDLSKINVFKKKILIINNWVDTSIFKLKDKQECRKRLNLPLDKKILLFVGRLSEEKGIFKILNCAQLLKDNDKFIFIIIGDGPLRNFVENKSKKMHNLIFLGPKDSFELADYYNASDCLFWGAVDVHYVSIVVMEALHCGLPVIAPNISCQDGKMEYVNRETLPDDIGVLIDVRDLKTLPMKIDNFFNKKFDRKTIKQYALEKYSEKNAERLFNYLEND